MSRVKIQLPEGEAPDPVIDTSGFAPPSLDELAEQAGEPSMTVLAGAEQLEAKRQRRHPVDKALAMWGRLAPRLERLREHLAAIDGDTVGGVIDTAVRDAQNLKGALATIAAVRPELVKATRITRTSRRLAELPPGTRVRLLVRGAILVRTGAPDTRGFPPDQLSIYTPEQLASATVAHRSRTDGQVYVTMDGAAFGWCSCFDVEKVEE